MATKVAFVQGNLRVWSSLGPGEVLGTGSGWHQLEQGELAARLTAPETFLLDPRASGDKLRWLTPSMKHPLVERGCFSTA